MNLPGPGRPRNEGSHLPACSAQPEPKDLAACPTVLGRRTPLLVSIGDCTKRVIQFSLLSREVTAYTSRADQQGRSVSCPECRAEVVCAKIPPRYPTQPHGFAGRQVPKSRAPIRRIPRITRMPRGSCATPRGAWSLTGTTGALAMLQFLFRDLVPSLQSSVPAAFRAPPAATCRQAALRAVCAIRPAVPPPASAAVANRSPTGLK